MELALLELKLYLGIVLLALLLAARPMRFTREIYFFLFYIVIFVVHAQVVRAAGYDIDIKLYADTMAGLQESLFVTHTPIDAYYQREPLVWLGQAVLYELLGSDRLVFAVSDTVIGLLVYRAFRNFSLPYYAYFAFLVFFPFILGFQNVYRQFFAAVFMLWLFSMPAAATWRGLMVYSLAVLSHQVAGVFVALFAYLWWDGKNRLVALLRGRRAWQVTLPLLMSLSVLLATPLLLFLGADTKSSGDTGANLVLLYLAILGGFLLFSLVLDGFRIHEADFTVYAAMITALWVTGAAALTLSPSGAERIGMFAMILLYPVIVRRLESLTRTRQVWRVGLVLGGFVPILLFGTRMFLLSSPS